MIGLFMAFLTWLSFIGLIVLGVFAVAAGTVVLNHAA